MAGRFRRPPLTPALAVALIACAHAPEEREVAAPARGTPARAEVGENQTDPVRKTCKGQGPQIPAGETVSGVVKATYLIGANGKVSDVKVTGKASPAALKAIRSFIATCTYAPATRDGKPVAVHWRGELDFTKAPGSQ